MVPEQLKDGFVVSIQDANGILRLTLNDPARRNVLSEPMLETLGAAFDQAGDSQIPGLSYWRQLGRYSVQVMI